MLVASPLHMAISSNHHAMNMNLRSTQGTFWILLYTFFLLVLPTNQLSAGPGPREGHCSFGFHDNLYVFGGYAQPNATRFSTVTLPIPHNESNTVPWTAVPSNGSYNIVDGACEVLPSGHAVFLGFDPNDPQTGLTPGFQTFNILTQSWATTATNGSDISQAFGTRRGMATVVINHLIVVFGGIVNGTDTQDTYVLDTSLGINQWIWKYIPPTPTTPLPSSFMDLSVSRGKVFFIGQESNTNGTKNDVIYSFDPTTLTWGGKVTVLGLDFDRLQVGNYKNARLFMLPTTMSSGALNRTPCEIWELQLWNNVAVNLTNFTHIFQPRIGASVAVVNTTNLVIYGGNNGTRLGDLYVFDMALRDFIYWNIPPVIFPTTRPSSRAPTPTSSITPVITGSNNLALILGLVIGILVLVIIIICCYFIITRSRKRRQDRLVARAYEDNPPGQILSDTDIAAIAEQSTIPGVQTWSQMLGNLTLGVGRHKAKAGAGNRLAFATAAGADAPIWTAEKNKNHDPEKGEIPDDTSSKDSGGRGRSQPMKEQDIGLIPLPELNPPSSEHPLKIRSATDRTHKRSYTLPSRFQEMLGTILPSRSNTISASSSSQPRRPAAENPTSGGPSTFAGAALSSERVSSGTRSGNGTESEDKSEDRSEDSDPPLFRRSW